jgi:hypothetical protein
VPTWKPCCAKSSSREELERAAADLEARAAKQPDDFQVRLGASIALTQVMAIRTMGTCRSSTGSRTRRQSRDLG